MARRSRNDVIKALDICTSLNKKCGNECAYDGMHDKINCVGNLMKDALYYLNNPSSEVVNKNSTKWCITTLCENLETVSYTEYLGWQTPLHIEDNGYFWTQRSTIKELIKNGMNTPEHPFIFNSRKEAIDHLKTINIPQKCRIVRWR